MLGISFLLFLLHLFHITKIALKDKYIVEYFSFIITFTAT